VISLLLADDSVGGNGGGSSFVGDVVGICGIGGAIDRRLYRVRVADHA
jgi:hypothetical protein